MVPKQLIEKIESAPARRLDYAQYMEEVLYHPVHGYYMKSKEKVGTKGDFITSSNVHDIYGKIFAKLFIQYFKETNILPVMIELGGGNGRFAAQLLTEVERVDPVLYHKLEYFMVEASPYHISLQRKAIPKSAHVTYCRTIDEISKDNGVIFSNELFDALPVHVVECVDGEVQEVFVTMDQEHKLVETWTPLANPAISDYLTIHDITLEEGQRLEVPLAMITYAKMLSEKLEKGSIITVDYGYRFSDLLHKERKGGSLRGYFNHAMVTNPLLHPYDMDLTTHVHLDALEKVFSEQRFNHICTMRQGEFLVAAGILDYLQENHDPNPFSDKSKQNRAIRTLIMDSNWSNSFHVLVHEKKTNVWSKLFKTIS
jgi:SAM-dependent MidA family methyltransferase